MRKILFILFVMVVTLTKVNAQVFYFGHGPYQETEDYIEESLTLEVIKEGDIYKYRSRNYVDIPGYIKVTSYDFDFEDVIKSNLTLEELNFNTDCDFNQNKDCVMTLNYENFSSGVLVNINIPENDLYINIPEEIIVTDYSFNILDYIDTNITDSLDITGDINLYENGIYNVVIKYKSKSVETKIIVDNSNNIKEEEKEPEIDIEEAPRVEEVPQYTQTITDGRQNSINEENLTINSNEEESNLEEEIVVEKIEKNDNEELVATEEKNEKLQKKSFKLWKPILVIILIIIFLALSKFAYRIK